MTHKVLLVHYHLRPGGVSTVLRLQAGALRDRGHQVVIASGESAPPIDGIPHHVLPGLGYRDAPLTASAIAALAGQLVDLADGGVVHIHNPCLGKNPSWPDLVNTLAARGQPMVLQVHDFIEDGRTYGLTPPVDRSRWYPQGTHLRWLVLNPTSAMALKSAGMAWDNISLIPNPVQALPLPAGPVDPDLVAYPTRGIKRKNLGEFLLLAALAPRGMKFSTTRVPEDPAQARVHARWQAFARAAGLPVTFGAGWPDRRPARCVSTSIQEGFGLALAEPWLAGIPATGRWLADATGLLAEAGWDPGDAYSAITVPSAWIPAGPLSRAVQRVCGKAAAPAVMACHFHADRMDFGRLPAFLQRHVLRAVIGHAVSASAIQWVLPDGSVMAADDWFAGWNRAGHATVANNCQILHRLCAPEAIARALDGHYAAVLAARPALHGHADASMVWEFFHSPERFHFLRLPP